MSEESTSGRPADAAHDQDEVIFFEGRPALRGSLGNLSLSGLIGLGLIAGALALHAKGWWIPLLGVVLAVVLLAIPVLLVRSVRYRITNYRIDYERGVFSKDIDTLELWHVEDIKFHQSLLDRILNLGQITVLCHDETTPTLLLKSIPHPRPVFEALKDRIITVKRQRGVIKLDAG
ncbi:MAG: PH domain-containing protein [Kiritimatiellaeota bacterium]|nr:PH domain-containing protein [Kiritimatiellota bacterium]